MTSEPIIYSNEKLAIAPIKLSIVSPFLGDNPNRWIEFLLKSPRATDAEIILIDDGTNDDALIGNLVALLEKWPAPARIISFKENRGRAMARNSGIDFAIGDYILFIDADVVPQSIDYLEKYFAIIEKKSAAIAFGGFIASDNNENPNSKFHHYIMTANDCRALADRKQLGAYAIASNNLLARKDLCLRNKFDENFHGWGWEDTEFVLRAVLGGFGLVHIENPVCNIEFETPQTLVRKYKEAAANLALLISKHEISKRFRAVKNARLVGSFPFHVTLRTICEKIVINNWRIFSLKIRRYALVFWRASWAADAINNLDKSKFAK